MIHEGRGESKACTGASASTRCGRGRVVLLNVREGSPPVVIVV